MSKTSSIWIVTLALLVGSGPAVAQPGQPGAPVFSDRVDVRVVNVEAYVTDRQGNPVNGLSKNDFELRVDGRPVEITHFYGAVSGRPPGAQPAAVISEDPDFRPLEAEPLEADRRLHLMIFLDNSRLQVGNRRRAFAAAAELVRERLHPDDVVTVVSFSGSLVFHSDFIYDRFAIEDILHENSKVSARSSNLELERRQIIAELTQGQTGGFLGETSTARMIPGQLLGRLQAYAQSEYDRGRQSIRLLEQVVGTLGGAPGRKALLYISDGIPNRPGEGIYNEYINRLGEGAGAAEPGLRRFDFNTDYRRDVGNFELMQEIDRLAERANEAGVTIYALDAESQHANDLRGPATEQGAISSSLSLVADNYRDPLEAAAKATGGRRIQASGLLDEHLRTLAQDFDSFYSLGFSPAQWDAESEHRIEIRVTNPRLVVRHRDGFRVLTEDQEAAHAMVSALLYQTLDNSMRFAATPRSADRTPGPDGSTILPVVVEIPIERISLIPRQDVHAGQLSLFVSVRDQAGNPGAVQKIPFHVNIPAEKVSEARSQSAHYTLPVVLHSGDQQVAIGVRDEVSGIMSTLRLDV